jgi:hypothetical protein
MEDEMAHAITPAQTALAQSINQPTVAKKDSDGSADKSNSSKLGPAVILNLTNTGKSDAAQGDPDGDGQ